MKITLDVELQSSEMERAAQIQHALSEFNSGSVEVRLQLDKTGLELRIRDAIKTQVCDSVCQELTELLMSPDAYEDALEVMCSAAFFSVERVECGLPVDSFVDVVRHLGDGARQMVRKRVVRRAVEFLSSPRRPDCRRVPLLPFCETIATFVAKDLLSIRSVAETIAHMVQQPHTRTAGATCLGKVMEIAYKYVRNADHTTLEAIRSSLSALQKDKLFAYDVEYISEVLGLVPSKHGYGLRRSCGYHKKPILALSYSGGAGLQYRETVVTSSADATIGTWDSSGELTETICLANRYAASLDLAARGHMLIVGGASKVSKLPPAVILYKEQQDHGEVNPQWAERGAVELLDAQFITSVRGARTATSNDAHYCVALSTHTGAHKLVVYDGTQYLQEYSDHTDIITAVHRFRDDAMLTGSRDRSVKLYDLRARQSVQADVRHSNTITSIGSCGDYIFTAGLDKSVVVTDVRAANRECARVEVDAPILDISVNVSCVCAVATATGLYTINFRPVTSSQPPTRVYCGTSNPLYNAVSWNAGGSVLYAGGASATLDMFDRQFGDTDRYDV